MNEFAFAAWHRSARSTIEVEGTAWASRYVLLCEWGESGTKFTMSVTFKTSCFRSKTPTESSCRQSRSDRRPPPLAAAFMYMYGLQVAQFWVYCESVPRQILLLGLPVITGAARGTRVLQFDKKIRSVPHFLQPPAIDKKPESNAKMYVNQRRDEMART